MRWRSLLFLPALAYQVLAIAAGVRHLRQRCLANKSNPVSFEPGVSVLKPISGLDPNTYEAFVSQAQQNYSSFEILFGVRDPSDPAVAEIHRLQREFPQVPIRLIYSDQDAANGKIGVLMDLAREARYTVWVVNDSDIKVTHEYLRSVVAPLADDSVGVVTCPYRATPHTPAAAWEALGIAVDFMPSALVAPLVGVREFGFGSTLAFRAADLQRAGGFAVLSDYLADDYQLAKRITGLQKRAVLSTYTVETALNDASWRGIWRHQLRWARTIRLSKGGGYAGLPITHAGLWAIVAALSGERASARILLGLRILSGLVTGGFVLKSPLGATLCWLSPVWDLYAFAVWMTSYSSNRVTWRHRVLTVDSEGRIKADDK
ncbi:MAG TPA: glycosyltransferase [Bryobacteraceae bacterium]